MRSSDTKPDAIRRGAPGPVPRGGAGRAAAAATVALLAAGAVTGRLEAQAGPVGGPGGGEAAAAAPAPFPAVAVGALREAGVSAAAEEAGRLVVEKDGRRLVLQLGNPFARLESGVVQLANAPFRTDGTTWLPREAVELLGGAPDGTPAEAAVRRRSPWRVVLDPGHGGKDPGAHGPRGTREKDVVLAIARRVAEKLRSEEGIEPILTREGDSFVPLAERSRRAVKEEADLFLSIHANAARDRRAAGFETYLLGEARTDWARQVAMRENSAVRYEDRSGRDAPDDVQVILANMDLNLYREESSFLAGTIQNALRTRVPAPDRGVKQNIYLVLANAGGSMPAVLVETGFITNRDGEHRLRNSSGQQKIADAIAEAVVRYFREREHRQGVQTAAR